MAIHANFVFEVRTGGADTNGGGFKSTASGTDRTLQDAAHATLSTSSVVHTTTTQINVAVGDYTVTSADVGNMLNLQGGSATAGLYEITAADTGNNRWTMDRAVGTAGQTCPGKMGGAYATPGYAAKAMTVSGNLCWVKAGTYTITTSTAGAAGPVALVNSVQCAMIGYSSTRGDYAGRPEVNAGAVTGVVLIQHAATAPKQLLVHLRADGNTTSGVTGFELADIEAFCIDCEAEDCVLGFSGGGAGHVLACGTINCTTSTQQNTNVYGCQMNKEGNLDNVTMDSYSYGGDGTIGSFNAYNCTHDGPTGANGSCFGSQQAIDCIATNSAIRYGYNSAAVAYLEHCADYNNSLGRLSTTPLDKNVITLTTDPYVDSAGHDYRVNNSAGGGLLLKGLAVLIGDMADGRDVGALQGADDSGHPAMRRHGLSRFGRPVAIGRKGEQVY